MLRNLTLLAVLVAALTFAVLAVLLYRDIHEPPQVSFSDGNPQAVCYQTPFTLACHVLQASAPVFLLPEPNAEAESPGLN